MRSRPFTDGAILGDSCLNPCLYIEKEYYSRPEAWRHTITQLYLGMELSNKRTRKREFLDA